MVTEGTGTIVISNKAFNAIGNGFIPDFVNMGNLHVLTLIIGIVGIAAYIWSEIKTRNDKIKYNFEVISSTMFTMKLVAISAVIGYITWILAGYNGLSWTVVITIIVVCCCLSNRRVVLPLVDDIHVRARVIVLDHERRRIILRVLAVGVG